ncbi:sensor histidine kinase [Actinoplanes sp. DH11]|uniref:sensor histidine kinase n=1 Tax=Actinoplanes sp. DH11 TaxID=2857011 RepID=UPI001E410F15|nr:sensor histidine kinase [Actinoplanes sp. DH11]
MLDAEAEEGSQAVREWWITWLTYGTLAGSFVLALATRDSGLPARPIPLVLLLTVVTAAWIGWWITLHPQWEKRLGHMLVFLAGLYVLNVALVWCSPFYGVFTWTGYLFVAYALPGRWRLAGAVPVAAVAAASQIGGVQNFAEDGVWLIYGAVLGCNVLIATVMLQVETRTEQNHARREQMLDELAEANAKLETAMRENAGLHAQLLVQAREAGVLDERQRMAGEIHDVLAQGLTGIVTQLEAAEGHPGERDRHLAAAKRLARESLTEARRSVQALRPQQLDSAALPEALGEIVEIWAERTGVKAELVTTGMPRRLLPEIETTLLRTAQEGLANVARHAGAHRVGLTLSYMEDVVTLDVRDDGAGFDPAQSRTGGADGGFGLQGMRERLARIAGTMEIESEPGGGTALSACVPAVAVGGIA